MAGRSISRIRGEAQRTESCDLVDSSANSACDVIERINYDRRRFFRAAPTTISASRF
jgi:hypothetical protein